MKVKANFSLMLNYNKQKIPALPGFFAFCITLFKHDFKIG
jgi:hypothetical protein